MKEVAFWIVAGFALAGICLADALARRCFMEDEEDEQARKKLIENQDKDIQLDGESEVDKS